MLVDLSCRGGTAICVGECVFYCQFSVVPQVFTVENNLYTTDTGIYLSRHLTERFLPLHVPKYPPKNYFVAVHYRE